MLGGLKVSVPGGGGDLHSGPAPALPCPAGGLSAEDGTSLGLGEVGSCKSKLLSTTALCGCG